MSEQQQQEDYECMACGHITHGLPRASMNIGTIVYENDTPAGCASCAAGAAAIRPVKEGYRRHLANQSSY